MKLIYRATNLAEAHIVLHQLHQADIEACVLNTHAQSAFGEIAPQAAMPQIWIAQLRHEAKALEILAKFQQPGDTREQFCPQCAEANPLSFELCWACGAAMPVQ